MKIAFIIQDLFYRGAQYATAMVANGFAAKGYEVDVLVSKVHDDYVAEEKRPFELSSKTRLIHLPSRHARQNVWAVRRYLRTTGAAAVIAMDSNYENALALASLGLVKRPRLYTVEHGIRFAMGRNYVLRKPHGWFSKEKLRRRFVYLRMDGVLTVSAGVAKELNRVFGVPSRKLHVVYNPVVDENFKLKLGHQPVHPWLKDKAVPTFVAAGQLEDCKGHDMAFKAMLELSAKRKVRLIVYGDGPLREAYEEWIRTNHLGDVISLPGFTDKLPSEIRHSDGYICTSRIESFGITVAEALAAKVPVVSVAVPSNGPVEILDNGRFGRLVKPEDFSSLALAIGDICDGRLTAAEDESWMRFTREAIVERYERAISKVEMLEPYKFDNFQFFKQWASDAWFDAGGSIRRERWLPWRLKFAFDKIGLAFTLPQWLKNGRKLLIASGGNPGYLSVPAGYRYEVVPMVWDCWERYWPCLDRFIRRNKVRLVFCTSSQTAEHVRTTSPSCKAIWIPEGIKVSLYPAGPELSKRRIDVLEMGRWMPGIHDELLGADLPKKNIKHVYQTGKARLFPDLASLTAGLQDAKLVVCYPRCDTHPELAGCVETLTQRYWECMLSGALIVGRAPQELIDFCGYDPVISLGADPVDQICDILNHIDDYQDLADKNRRFAEIHADWSERIPILFNALKELDGGQG